MPIPTPSGKEERDAFVSRCIKTLSKRDPDRPRKQVIAICYTAWREKGKKGVRGGDRGGSHSRQLR